MPSRSASAIETYKRLLRLKMQVKLSSIVMRLVSYLEWYLNCDFVVVPIDLTFK